MTTLYTPNLGNVTLNSLFPRSGGNEQIIYVYSIMSLFNIVQTLNQIVKSIF